LAFLTQNKGKSSKILIITLVFKKNANFFAENCQKSQKIMIITSTPAHQNLEKPDRFKYNKKYLCRKKRFSFL
jgi:hypothetical protein